MALGTSPHIAENPRGLCGCVSATYFPFVVDLDLPIPQGRGASGSRFPEQMLKAADIIDALLLVALRKGRSESSARMGRHYLLSDTGGHSFGSGFVATVDG